MEEEPLTIVDLDGVLVLAPRVSIVTKLAGKIERLREEAGLTEEDLLSGLPEERRRLFSRRDPSAGSRRNGGSLGPR